jgi:hypothetical protein
MLVALLGGIYYLAVGMAASGMKYISYFMQIGSSIPIILWSLPQQSERLQFWYDAQVASCT